MADGFALCILGMKTHDVEFEHGQRIAGSDHRFAGTGAYAAYQCWKVNRDAIRAVNSAYAEDRLSGGEVRRLNLVSGEHNVGSEISWKAINRAAVGKGMVIMEKNAVPLAEAAKNDPLVDKAMKDIASGNLSAHAPAGKDPVVWTDADIKRLDDALAKCFGPKK